MTSSGSDQQPPDNSSIPSRNSPGRWGFLGRLVPGRIKQEIKQQIREEVKEQAKKELGTQAEQKVREALGEFNVDEKLNDIVDKFTKETMKIKEDNLDKQLHEFNNKVTTIQEEIKQQADEQRKKIKRQADNQKERLNRDVAKQLKSERYAYKSYKNIDGELLKIRAFIIGIPIILGFLAVVFNDDLKDILSIDVLENRVELLEDRVKSSNQTQEQVTCLPGEKICCPPDDFFSC